MSATASTWLFPGFFCGLGLFRHRLGAFLFGHLLSTDLFLGRALFTAAPAAAAFPRAAFLAGTNCAVRFATSAASGMQVAGNRGPDGRHQRRDAEAGENLLQLLTIHCILLCMTGQEAVPDRATGSGLPQVHY